MRSLQRETCFFVTETIRERAVRMLDEQQQDERTL